MQAKRREPADKTEVEQLEIVDSLFTLPGVAPKNHCEVKT